MKDMEGISEKIASIREALDELEELATGDSVVEDDDTDDEEPKKGSSSSPLKKNVKDSTGKKKVHMMLALIGKKR